MTLTVVVVALGGVTIDARSLENQGLMGTRKGVSIGGFSGGLGGGGGGDHGGEIRGSVGDSDDSDSHGGGGGAGAGAGAGGGGGVGMSGIVDRGFGGDNGFNGGLTRDISGGL
jgi:hypothetical protein